MNPKKIFVVTVGLLVATFVISLAPAFAETTVTSPNGGEVWVVESEHMIEWEGGSGRWTISYSTNSGVRWLPVASRVFGERYLWTIPNTPSENCRVRVHKESYPYQEDESDGDFTIEPQTITVTSPNGGENWGVGGTHYIQWTTYYFTDSVKIDYSTNSGLNWFPITDTTSNDGIYAWITPNTPSANCRVRVSDYKDSLLSDVSDNDFVISKITVSLPNGGEYWCIDSTYNIIWNSDFFIDYVKLEYTTDNGGLWQTIINCTQNSGIYPWKIPNTSSTNCKVRVSDCYDGDPADVSDNLFTIGGTAIAVIDPNGGEELCVDSTYSIKWNSHCFVGYVKLEYSTNSGSNWGLIISSTPNDGNYDWIVPNTLSTNCQIKVSDATDGSPYDISDNDFAIHTTSISIISPNTDSCWSIGSKHDIRWISFCYSGNVKIEYQTEQESEWKIITNGTEDDGIYTWTVPAETSCTVRVKISNPILGVPYDTSDANFSIGPASIRLTSPNGGEYWQGGSTHDITWSYFCCPTPIKIQCSTDGGGNWQTITASTENDGVYSLDALQTTTNLTHCRIRVCDAVKGQPCDGSDNDFTIYPPPRPPSSCPYLFVWDGSGFVKDNTILTASENNPSGKVVTDFYKIQKPLVVKENKYHLQIKELEEEKSFVDQVELMVIDHPAGLKIGVTPDGKIFEMEESISPISAVDDKGVDQLAKVKEADGDIYMCTEPGSLTIKYSLPENSSADIAVGGMGRVLKDLKHPCNIPEPQVNRFSPEGKQTLKGVRAEVQDKNGAWIELPVAPPRTTLIENFWMLDTPTLDLGNQFQVRISWDREYSADELKYFVVSKNQPEITSVSLVSANHNIKGYVKGLLSDADDKFVTLTKGEILDLYYSAEKPLPDGMVRDFVFKTTGYYLINYKEQFSLSANEFILFNNFPNPANPITEISYNLPVDCNVQLTIYNILGQKVKTLVDNYQEIGHRTEVWDGKNDQGEEVSSGIYFYNLKAGDFTQTRKMVLMK